MAASDQADLIRRLVAGDAFALEEAYKLHAERCNAIAYRVLRNGESARDAVQEAFLALWRHRDGLVVRTAGLGPWLSVVVRNAAIGMLRRETGRTRREERADHDGDSQVAPDPADFVTSRAQQQRLLGALRELPPEQQSVVEMAYFKYLTMAQIAERTETPLGTVKRRAQLALRHLGRIMSEQKP
jgi:RNA polymerase sigma-70 factor (ECF subfamily)